MVAGKLGGLIALVLGGLLTNFASAGSDSDSDTARSSLSLTYLQLLPDESIESLSEWCGAHVGEPVSTNPVIDVPNYVSCDEVVLLNLKRAVEDFDADKLADNVEERLGEGFTCENPPKDQDKEMTDLICIK